MDPKDWIRRHGGIAHRRELEAAGWGAARLRELDRIGRGWVAIADAPELLVAAARRRGRLACVTAARHLGLELLHPPSHLHLVVPREGTQRPEPDLRLHRSRAIRPVGRYALVESLPDVLANVARCLPEVEALIVWESAVRLGLVHLDELRRLAWPGPRQRRLARLVSGRSDSLLETLLAHQLRAAAVPYRQQVRFHGRPVDFLIGERLIIQVDGYAHHQAAQRRSDIAFDAQLVLEGRHVLRFDYVQVTEASAVPVVLRAISLGLAH